MLREEKTGLCSERICYPDVSSCLTITFRNKSSLAGVHLTVASDKKILKEALLKMRELSEKLPREIVVSAPFSTYKKHVKDDTLNTRAKLSKIIAKTFPHAGILMHDTSDTQSSHIFVSKNEVRHVNSADHPVIGNQYPRITLCQSGNNSDDGV
ncbi:MAG: hypothetical protein HYZ77_05525 [Serratia liquefaciens]|nr:hypothetical protein [Serratia liquefaciens]